MARLSSVEILHGLGDCFPVADMLERPRELAFLDEPLDGIGHGQVGTTHLPSSPDDEALIGSKQQAKNMLPPYSPTKSPLGIMFPQETALLALDAASSPPSIGPPPLTDVAADICSPVVISPLRRYLCETHRYEMLVTGESSGPSDCWEGYEGAPAGLSAWAAEFTISSLALDKISKSTSTRASIWSDAGTSPGSSPAAQAAVSPDPDPLNGYLGDADPSQRLAVQLQSAPAPTRQPAPSSTSYPLGIIPLEPQYLEVDSDEEDTAADAAGVGAQSPGSGSSISVDSAIDKTMGEQAVRFGSLSRTLEAAGLGGMSSRYRINALGKRREYKAVRLVRRKRQCLDQE